MRRAALLAIFSAASMHAAVIRGMVVENFTGKVLTRALVIVKPLIGTPGDDISVRTDRFGGFAFKVPAGVYIVKASRRGFLAVEYGQKRWNSAGQPLTVTEAEPAFLNIRLPRYGAVAGTVYDENEIGLPGLNVSVYRATQPPEIVTQVKTDERGQYRAGGLVPGKYVVRTDGGQYEDGSYVPTFSRETPRYEQAQVAEVFLEQQTDHVDVRPLPGRTYSLAVGIDIDPPGTPVKLTIASETGRTTVETSSGYTFSGLSPGDYDVYCETMPGYALQGAFQRVQVPGKGVTLLVDGPVGIGVGGDTQEKGEFWVRRKDPAGVGPVDVISSYHAALPSGRWEVLLRPPNGYHVSNVNGGGVVRRGRPDGWNEVILMRRQSGASFRLGSGAGSITGIVKDTPYAPVYLEGYDAVARQRVGELWTARADAQGRYRFENLAPGMYRLLSTYEYLSPESDTFDLATAVGVTLDAHGAASKDLELWVIR
jgi:hypothetical protein